MRLIEVGELKTQVEESRWEKMKAAVGEFSICSSQDFIALMIFEGALAVLSLVIIVSMEIYVVAPSRAAKKRAAEQARAPPPPPELPPSPSNNGDLQSLNGMT